MMDPMKHALMKRRGKGLSITISVDDGKDGAKTDLAPSVNDKIMPGQHPMEGSMQEEAMESPKEESAEDSLYGGAIDGMSDYDKEDMMNRKPRSLGDRVKMAALMKGKK